MYNYLLVKLYKYFLVFSKNVVRKEICFVLESEQQETNHIKYINLVIGYKLWFVCHYFWCQISDYICLWVDVKTKKSSNSLVHTCRAFRPTVEKDLRLYSSVKFCNIIKLMSSSWHWNSNINLTLNLQVDTTLDSRTNQG